MLQKNPILLGHLVITGDALNGLVTMEEYEAALSRQSTQDWTGMSEADQILNELAVQVGGHLFSTHTSSVGVRFWLITSGDRSETILVLPDIHPPRPEEPPVFSDLADL